MPPDSIAYDLDPDELSPDGRLRELATILAVGIRRLIDRAAIPSTSPENSCNFLPNDLASPREKSVTVHAG